MDVHASVVAMAALRMASGATDEEWAEVMKRITNRRVPRTADEVVTDVRTALAEVRSTECCCTWGAAVGKRHGVPSEEWPEFGCYQCPVHRAGMGEQPDELCKRHRDEAQQARG